MGLLLHQLLYSNFSGAGRRFRAASLEPEISLQHSIEAALGASGDPTSLSTDERLFCRLDNGWYLYSRFLQKGRELNSNRRAQTYHCILLSPRDFDRIHRQPFELESCVIWLDQPPDNPKLAQVRVGKHTTRTPADSATLRDYREASANIHREIKGQLVTLLSCLTEEKHLRLPKYEYRIEIMKAAVACLPYYYRQALSFTTYYNSIQRGQLPFLVCFDHREDPEVDTDTVIQLPYAEQLDSFLKEPNRDLANRLYGWLPVKKTVKPSQPDSASKKSPEASLPLKNTSAPPVILRPTTTGEFSRSSGHRRVLLLVAISIAAISMCVEMILTLVDYRRCRKIEELPEATINPERVYDAYYDFSHEHSVFAALFDVNRVTDRYRLLASEDLFERNQGVANCTDRIEANRAFLAKYRGTPKTVSVEVLVAADLECATWEQTLKTSSELIKKRNYAGALSAVRVFLTKYDDGEYESLALALEERSMWLNLEKDCRDLMNRRKYEDALVLLDSYLLGGNDRKFVDEAELLREDVKWKMWADPMNADRRGPIRRLRDLFGPDNNNEF